MEIYHSECQNHISHEKHLLNNDSTGGYYTCHRTSFVNNSSSVSVSSENADRQLLNRNGLNFTQMNLGSNSADSRLSVNSTDSTDAPLLLNEQYNDFDGMDEFHCHSNDTYKRNNKALRKLLAASCMCWFFMVTEIMGGYLANSLAVMTDAAHLLSDYIGFIISLFSIWLGQRTQTKRMSFGFHRAEILGALFSIIIVWILTAIFMYLAVYRLIYDKYDIEANTMIVVSVIGVFINIVMGLILHGACVKSDHVHSHGAQNHSHHNSQSQYEPPGNINVRAAVIHVLGDLIQSIGVLIASFIIKFYPSAKIADPICTFIFSIIVILTTKNVLRDILNVLMEGVPFNINYNAVKEALKEIDGVRHVHDLHIWSLTIDKNALTAHLAVDKLCDKEDILHHATVLLKNKFLVSTVTIQVEKYKEYIVSSCSECQLPKD